MYSKEIEKKALDFAKSKKFDGVEYRIEFNGYSVFFAYINSCKGAVVGMPSFILANNDEVRFADEVNELDSIIYSLPEI